MCYFVNVLIYTDGGPGSDKLIARKQFVEKQFVDNNDECSVVYVV